MFKKSKNATIKVNPSCDDCCSFQRKINYPQMKTFATDTPRPAIDQLLSNSKEDFVPLSKYLEKRFVGRERTKDANETVLYQKVDVDFLKDDYLLLKKVKID